MKNGFSKLTSWIHPVLLETTRGELGHVLEVNMNNGKIVLDTDEVNYSYGSLQDVFDFAFTKTKLYERPISSVLITGFGSGSVSCLLRKKCNPNVKVTGIEADREVIRLAKKYFPEATNEKVNIVHSDAGQYIRNEKSNYDLIVVDVFVNDEVPESCQSADFFSSLKARLNAGGKIYVNKMERSNDKIGVAELEKNFRSVFQDARVIRVPINGSMNYVFVGTLS